MTENAMGVFTFNAKYGLTIHVRIRWARSLKQTIAQLHADCDFIVENYDLRKAARENEIEGLANAKSVLSGADFGL